MQNGRLCEVQIIHPFANRRANFQFLYHRKLLILLVEKVFQRASINELHDDGILFIHADASEVHNLLDS